MTYTPDDFDDCAYTHAPQQVQADRDLSHPDRDAISTAAQYRRPYTVAEWLMGLASLASLVALGTQHLWGPWLGVWGVGD